jgi:hypothetical protein
MKRTIQHEEDVQYSKRFRYESFLLQENSDILELIFSFATPEDIASGRFSLVCHIWYKLLHPSNTYFWANAYLRTFTFVPNYEHLNIDWKNLYQKRYHDLISTKSISFIESIETLHLGQISDHIAREKSLANYLVLMQDHTTVLKQTKKIQDTLEGYIQGEPAIPEEYKNIANTFFTTRQHVFFNSSKEIVIENEYGGDNVTQVQISFWNPNVPHQRIQLYSSYKVNFYNSLHAISIWFSTSTYENREMLCCRDTLISFGHTVFYDEDNAAKLASLLFQERSEFVDLTDFIECIMALTCIDCELSTYTLSSKTPPNLSFTTFAHSNGFTFDMFHTSARGKGFLREKQEITRLTTLGMKKPGHFHITSSTGEPASWRVGFILLTEDREPQSFLDCEEAYFWDGKATHVAINGDVRVLAKHDIGIGDKVEVQLGFSNLIHSFWFDYTPQSKKIEIVYGDKLEGHWCYAVELLTEGKVMHDLNEN